LDCRVLVSSDATVEIDVRPAAKSAFIPDYIQGKLQ
jgi:hypothetical protein